MAGGIGQRLEEFRCIKFPTFGIRASFMLFCSKLYNVDYGNFGYTVICFPSLIWGMSGFCVCGNNMRVVSAVSIAFGREYRSF